MATFKEIAAHSVRSLYQHLIVFSRLGFKGWSKVLIHQFLIIAYLYLFIKRLHFADLIMHM